MAKSKKELDKELMYSKLMPSIPRVEEEEEEIPLPDPILEEEQDEGSLSSLRSRLFGEQSSIQSPSDGPIQLVNLMEDLIIARLDDVFAKFNCCQCDHCRKDVVAMALNKLPSRYAVGTAADLKALSEKIPTKDISAALIQAVLCVRSHPRHRR